MPDYPLGSIHSYYRIDYVTGYVFSQVYIAHQSFICGNFTSLYIAMYFGVRVYSEVRPDIGTTL